MQNPSQAPTNEAALEERGEMLRIIEQAQQQVIMAQQRIAFLNGVLTARDVDLSAPTVPTVDVTAKNSSKTKLK